MFWYDEQRIDGWVAELKECEAQIGDLRARQGVLINESNKRDIAQRHGARTIVEWVESDAGHVALGGIGSRVRNALVRQVPVDR